MKNCLTDNDVRVFQREIQPFLPSRIVDFHAHLESKRLPYLADVPGLAGTPEVVDRAVLTQWWEMLFPGVEVSALLLPFPYQDADVAAANARMAQEAAAEPFSIQITPAISTAELEQMVTELRPFGLKPYLWFAPVEDVQQACITDFLPEAQIEVADRYGLAVTLHVSRPRGMADEDNLEDIQRLVRDYPNCRFILAHCGRCFIPINMQECLDRLPVAENLWIDTSAVCEAGVFLQLFNRYDRSRICYGTDLVSAAGFRGRYVGLGMTWNVVNAEMVTRPGGLVTEATYAVYENLRATLQATRALNFTEQDYQNFFYNNAQALLKR